MTALTRGPLPSRVYWTRRVLLLVVVAGVVVGLVQLVALAVGGGSATPPDRAAPAAAEPTSETAGGPEAGAEAATTPTEQQDRPPQKAGANGTKGKQGKKEKKDRQPVLAEPEGPCVDRDVAVTPTAEETVGGSPITFTLELRTVQSVACTWEVSPRTLSVRITSGKDPIWFSSQCPRSIRKQDVVLRNNVTTEVEVTWSARRSEEDCGSDTDWAMPGWYHVSAAALAGEPSDLQFELTKPAREVRIETVAPEPKQGGKKSDQKSGSKSDKKQDRDRG